MQSKSLSSQGFRLRSILIHSIWITILGLVLFRLATANTQTLLHVKVFAISGTVLATTPWVVQLLVSTVIILSYNAGVCDLTWLISTEEGLCSQGSKAVSKDNEDGGVLNGNERGLYSVHGGNNGADRCSMHVAVEKRRSPQLQRNRTV